jgi:hypothetical protein
MLSLRAEPKRAAAGGFQEAPVNDAIAAVALM